MQAATTERTRVEVERQNAQQAFDGVRLEVDQAQRELDALKARLAEEEVVSQLLEARLETLAAEMLDEAPDVISRATSEAIDDLQLSATRIRGLKIQMRAAEAALRGRRAALDRAVYVERVEVEAAEIDRDIQAAEQAFTKLDRIGTAANKLGSDGRRRQRGSRSEMARRNTPWNRYPRTTEGPEPSRWLPTRCPGCGDGRISCAACGRCRKCCRMVQLARQMANGRGPKRPPKGDQEAP